MDKSVKYALLGLGALVAFAVGMHMMSDKEEAEEDENLNEDLKDLGDLQLDERGHIEFEQFL